MILLTIYDASWLCAVYAFFYWCWKKLLGEHAGVFKVLFDVQVRVNNLSREVDVFEHHLLLHTLSASCTYILLGINPLLHTLVFLCYRFVDIILLNRLVLNLTLLKLFRYYNPLRIWAPSEILPRADVLANAGHLLLTSINYTNRAMLFPALFQLADELFGLDVLGVELERVHRSVFHNDTALSGYLLNALALFKSRARLLSLARISVLVTLFLISLAYSNLHGWQEILFYYFAGFRLARLISRE
jgi:hypothetical protein